MSIMRGSAAVGFARVMAGALGALVVALAVFPTVAYGWVVESVHDGASVRIQRESSDTSATPVRCFGKPSTAPPVGLEWQDRNLGSTPWYELYFDDSIPADVMAAEIHTPDSVGGMLVVIGEQSWYLTNEITSYVVPKTVKVTGELPVFLAGIYDLNYDQKWFGDGARLESVMGTVSVAAGASDVGTAPVSIVGTVAVSSMPTLSLNSSGAVSSDASGAVSMPSTITVTGFGSFDSQALDVALVILIVVFAAVLIYVIRPGDRRG